MNIQPSETTDRARDLFGSNVNSAKLHRLILREDVHGFQRDVEGPGARMIYRQHINGHPGGRVGQLPACATIDRVEAFDRAGGADEGKLGDRTKRREPRCQSVYAGGAGLCEKICETESRQP